MDGLAIASVCTSRLAAQKVVDDLGRTAKHTILLAGSCFVLPLPNKNMQLPVSPAFGVGGTLRGATGAGGHTHKLAPKDPTAHRGQSHLVLLDGQGEEEDRLQALDLALRKGGGRTGIDVALPQMRVAAAGRQLLGHGSRLLILS